MQEIIRPEIGFAFTLPISGFVSVVSLAVFGLPGNGIQLAPGLPFGQVHLARFLLGKLLVRNGFLHNVSLLMLFKYDIMPLFGFIKDLSSYSTICYTKGNHCNEGFYAHCKTQT
jgi:hypothetical protein